MFYVIGGKFKTRRAGSALAEYKFQSKYRSTPAISVTNDRGTKITEIELDELEFDAETEAVLDTYADYCIEHGIEDDYHFKGKRYLK